MSTTPGREAGNAVALTLLGLAVAILAGVLVLYLIGRQAPVPVPVETDVSADAAATDTAAVDPTAAWNTYENAMYGFAFRYAPGWIVATGTVLGVPVITAYDAAQGASGTSTVDLNSADTRFSVYPQGMPDAEVGNKEVDSDVIVSVPRASAKDYVLEGSDRPWATVARFDVRPASWSDTGVVFMRARIEEDEVDYLRGTATVTPDVFDPKAGDVLAHSGFVDPAARNIEENMLRSFHFLTAADTVPNAGGATADMVHVASPTPNAIVTSPLTVRGEARVAWYQNGTFSVALDTADGTVLAQVPVTALSDAGTDGYVPFEVSVVFDVATATSGVLTLSSERATGTSPVSVPVRFATE